MIRAWVANAEGAREVPLAEAQRVAKAGGGNAWIDIEGEDEAATNAALGPLAIHPLVIEDMVMDVNRPKVDDYGDYLYLVVHSARWEPEEERASLRELDIIVGQHVLVTYHEHETRSAKAAAETLPRRAELLAKGPAVLTHFLLDVLVDNYLPIMDRIAEDVDKLEEDVFLDTAPTINARIIRIKRGLGAMRRIIGPQRDTILALTRDEFRTVPAEVRPYLRDVYDRLARISDLLDTFRDEVSSLLELHVSVTSSRMNEVIKRLTVIATIGLPLTVVTSYFGMNFDMAEFHWKHGEWFAIGVLAVTALATWLYLRAKHWD